VVVVLAVGVVTWVVIARADDEGSSPVSVPKGVSTGGPRTGEPAPDFTLGTLDGKPVRLSDYRGKPVVLNFWRSDCNPCRREFPLFRRELAEHPGEFVVLGVDTLNDIESDAKDFVKEEKAKWPIAVDSAHSDVAKAYGVGALPQTFFITPNGKVALRYYAQIPDDKWSEAVAKITR
jgi:cytochrome c biogenesis protein CcmG, thiol:disulfide interchange protein DsbE